MAFKLIWTDGTGSHELEIESAGRAYLEWKKLNGQVLNLVVKDDHRRTITPTQLVVMEAMARKGE